jgi:hypothetical protein
VKTSGLTRHLLAQLVFVFTCQFAGDTHGIALILPFDANTGPHRKIDKDLKFYRCRAKPRSSAEFISVRSIIRGIILIEDFDKRGDYLMLDTLDSDIFLRVHTKEFI